MNSKLEYRIARLEKLIKEQRRFVMKKSSRKTLKERLSKRADELLGKALDDICHKESDKEIVSVLELKKALKNIEKGAKDLECDFNLSPFNSGRIFNVDEFCDKATKDWNLFDDENSYLEIFWVDGEPGDNYMLCLRDFDDEDVLDGLAEFIFIPYL